MLQHPHITRNWLADVGRLRSARKFRRASLGSVNTRAGIGAEGRESGAPQEDVAWQSFRWLAQFWLLAADVTALGAALIIVVAGTDWFGRERLTFTFATWAAVSAWLALRSAAELYKPQGLPPPERLRRSFGCSFLVLIFHASLLVASGTFADGWKILQVWVLVLPLTYGLRGLARGRMIALGSYGVPIAIIGNGHAAQLAIRELQLQPDLGYVPIAVFSTENSEDASPIHGVPILGRAGDAPRFNFGYTVSHALIAVGSGWDDECDQELPQQLASRFPYLQTLTKLTGCSLWLARTRAIGPHLSIETRYVRFGWRKWLLKRGMDLGLSLPALVLVLPMVLLAGLAVFVADPGPIFFSQTREGRHGRPIKIYKLRSMIGGADAKLSAYLATNEAARFEYERTLKLRQDPRIIRYVGQFIRKSSIDEIPQLWSVIKGDMSLVGPRVMPTLEIDLYSVDGRRLRREVRPGLSGLWQVEHRSNSDFKARETADSFYVCNWSIWLDLWILLRTFRAVLSGSGAA